MSEQRSDRYRTYPPDTEAEISAVQEALHSASSMLVIEEALHRATMPGARWPQSSHGDYPNPAFSLAVARLLMRCPGQVRSCLAYAGWTPDA
jgi:hypothetical protein